MVEKNTNGIERLLDPCNDRQVTSVPAPPRYPLSTERLFCNNGKPDMAMLRTFLSDGGTVSKECINSILTAVNNVYQNEPNLMHVKEPVVIIGDIHGQYYDMIHMFEKVIDPKGIPQQSLLFLGDYVDRGIFSLEVLVFLFCLKICHPKEVVMLRGNHESRAMTEHFTFRNEILQKFDDEEDIYERFIDVFEAMPIAADVNGDYLCMHGGISKELEKTSDIDKIDRFQEPPLSGFLCDLLWADPLDDKDARRNAYTKNPQRECSIKFGLEPVKKILKQNNYISIIRAHQVQVDGYKMHRWGGDKCFPSVITIFSAPNYCGEYHNKGAVILIQEQKMNIKQYKEVPSPFFLPGQIDLFHWSVPFLSDKVLSLFRSVCNKYGLQPGVTDDEIKKMDLHQMLEDQAAMATEPIEEDKAQRKAQKLKRIQAKVKTVARMNMIFQTLKDNQEEIVKIKQMMPDGRLPKWTLIGGSGKVHEVYVKFYKTKVTDQQNEGFPVLSRRLSEKTRQKLNMPAPK